MSSHSSFTFPPPPPPPPKATPPQRAPQPYTQNQTHGGHSPYRGSGRGRGRGPYHSNSGRLGVDGPSPRGLNGKQPQATYQQPHTTPARGGYTNSGTFLANHLQQGQQFQQLQQFPSSTGAPSSAGAVNYAQPAQQAYSPFQQRSQNLSLFSQNPPLHQNNAFASHSSQPRNHTFPQNRPQFNSQPCDAIATQSRDSSSGLTYSNVSRPRSWVNQAPLSQHSTSPPPQPQMMGPPIRMGFEETKHLSGHQRPNSHSFNYVASHNQSNAYNADVNSASNDYLSQRHRQRSSTHRPTKRFKNGVSTHKRSYTDGVQHSAAAAPRPKAAPAVPSFLSSSLPAKPLSVKDHRKEKKKRHRNMLGLTPKSEEQQESEEEDIDEEAVLRESFCATEKPLEFTYEGHTSTLQSAKEIAAWIEERKKNFPTKQRIEEKRAMENRQNEAAINRREALKGLKSSKKAKKAKRSATTTVQAAKEPDVSKADTDISRDDLINKVKEQERLLAGLNAKLAECTDSAAVATSGVGTDTGSKRKRENEGEEDITRKDGTQNTPMKEHGDDTITCKEVDADSTFQQDIKIAQASAVTSCQERESSLGIKSPEGSQGSASHSVNDDMPTHNSYHSSSTLDYSDETSSDCSSSSSSSDSSDESDDEDDEPEEKPSLRRSEELGPEKIPPPPRQAKKPLRVCRHFLSRAGCKRMSCRFSHELPSTGEGGLGRKKTRKDEGRQGDSSKAKRKGLYQRMVEQETEKVHLLAVQTIKRLGEGGVLNDDQPKPPIQNGGDDTHHSTHLDMNDRDGQPNEVLTITS
ncbi:MAG: hypothetical protein M1837_003896 [Sclerophora amabilis]|nr:MAG: hypothetical protein M1837_003896 [Sclerophora amabilis]